MPSRTRSSVATRVTVCPVCERTIGIWVKAYTGRDRTAYSAQSTIKIAPHQTSADRAVSTRRCSGSGLAISPNVVMDNRQSA